MKVYSLKEHFELRNIASLNPRNGVGRLFVHKDAFGLSDGTGAVWPLKLGSGVKSDKLKVGCVYSFTLRGELPKSTVLSKYRDNETLLEVNSLVYQSGSDQSDWDFQGIADPRFAPIISDTFADGRGTYFFTTRSSERLRTIVHRNQGIQGARRHFTARGYLELDPPQLVQSGGVERYLKTFKTEYCDHRGHRWTLELPTSPEFALKKIVAEGAARIFALTHAFRNDGELSRNHDPEFMMLEWYRIGGSFESLLEETQSLICTVASSIQSAVPLSNKPWPVFQVSELFQRVVGIDLNSFQDVEVFRTTAARVSASIVASDTWDDVFCKLFMEFVEPFLQSQGACFVTHYPEQMGALAEKNRQFPGTVDRFEAYLNGIEICNGYRELIDEGEYRRRVTSIVSEREDVLVDPQFDSVMAAGLYPCVGNALGLDRLIAVLSGEQNIQRILPWPFASRFRSGTVALE